MTTTPFTDVVASGSKLLVRQIKEWTEILTGFETKNRYGVYAADGVRELAFIAEESGVVGRFFLAQSRACTLHVYDGAKREIAQIDKPFTWYLHEMKVVEQGRTIGSVERQLGIPVLRRHFIVRDAQGVTVAQIHGAIWRPWTFTVNVGGRDMAVISKGWGGALKELFTTADNFGLEFTGQISDDLRKLLLAATMLVDFCYFEDKN